MNDNNKQDQNSQPRAPIRRAAIVPKYSPLLYSLLFFMLVDFLINAFSELLVFSSIALLVIYILQDISILFTALVLLLMLINTYMFQAGLMGYMIFKFKTVWLLTVIYLALCLALQAWLMITRWSEPLKFEWQQGQTALYVFQRLVSIIFYYMYKRTAYRLSDPRFYEDSEWLRKEFEKRHYIN